MPFLSQYLTNKLGDTVHPRILLNSSILLISYLISIYLLLCDAPMHFMCFLTYLTLHPLVTIWLPKTNMTAYKTLTLRLQNVASRKQKATSLLLTSAAHKSGFLCSSCMISLASVASDKPSFPFILLVLVLIRHIHEPSNAWLISARVRLNKHNLGRLCQPLFSFTTYFTHTLV